MYQTIEQFTSDWAIESSLTVKVLSLLTDASLQQRVTADKGRTLGALAWHIASSVTGMLQAGGLQVAGPDFHAPVPATAQEIADRYKQASEDIASALTAQWTDEKLGESLLLFGSIQTTYGGLLSLFLRHEIHHRGQLTILMRQAGLVPPGVYGPNEEESAAMFGSKK